MAFASERLLVFVEMLIKEKLAPSKTAIARDTGLKGPSNLNEMIRGRQRVPADYLQKFFKVYNITPNEFFCFKTVNPGDVERKFLADLQENAVDTSAITDVFTTINDHLSELHTQIQRNATDIEELKESGK